MLQQFHVQLDELHGREEVNSFFNLLIEHYLDYKRIKLVLNPELEITRVESKLLLSALEDLKSHKPVQYIIGETEFYGLSFKVNKNVLIPRPETEELVEDVLMSLKQRVLQNENFRVLDIGTGSGCIAIALAKYLPKAEVFAIDISEDAIKVAVENANLNDIAVDFFQYDILNNRHAHFLSSDNATSHLNRERRELQIDKFDCIVSNPPYVRQQEKLKMKHNVLDSEPHLALFVKDENPLQFYEAICEFCKKYLKVGGSLNLEINEYLGPEMIGLLNDYEFEKIELQKDIFGKDRMVKGMYRPK